MLPNGFYHDLEGVSERELNFICYGIPRSGSTFVYQLICGVYFEGIAKTHRYSNANVKTLVCYRDFRDIMVSSWRVTKADDLNRKMSDDELIKFANQIRTHVKVLDDYFARKDICPLKYERFFNCAEYIFSAIKSKFGEQVSFERIKQLGFQCSMEENRKIASRFSSFNQFDPVSQIHGNHIYQGKIDGWHEFVHSYQIKQLEDILGPSLIRYGYAV